MRRIPGAFSTVGVGNRHTCSLTHRNGRIRLGPHPIAVDRFAILGVHDKFMTKRRTTRPLQRSTGAKTVPTLSISIQIDYSSNACVHTLTHSLNGRLNINKCLAHLHHAQINQFTLPSSTDKLVTPRTVLSAQARAIATRASRGAFAGQRKRAIAHGGYMLSAPRNLTNSRHHG